MKIPKSSLPVSVFVLLLFGSCSSTETIDKEPDKPIVEEPTRLRVKIATNDLTRNNAYVQSRANDDGTPKETTITSLKIAFYHGDKLLGFEDAEKDAVCSTEWKVNVPQNTDEMPDAIIAYANLDEGTNITTAKNVLSQLTVDKVMNSKGNFIMSNAHYFDGETHNEICATPLSASDFLENADPVTIHLERVAAKVGVTKESSFEAPAITMKNGDTDNTLQLNLKITGWGITGVEKSSYLIKQYGNGYDALATELAGWTGWNQEKNKTNWAHSKNYDLTTFPSGYKGSITDDVAMKYTKYNELLSGDQGFSEFLYPHETTRPKSNYLDNEKKTIKLNSLPSVVIAGQYSIDESPATFFRKGDKIYGLTEYWDLMAKRQGMIFKDDKNTPLTGTELQTIAEAVHPESAQSAANLVTIQLKENADLSAFKGKNNSVLPGKDDINEAFTIVCGYMEKYEQGQCFFIVPIQHLGYKTSPDVTGSYGIVRNHYYKINLQSIKGMGMGVADVNDYMVESTAANSSGEYSVSFSVNVVPWTIVEQNINIPKEETPADPVETPES